MSSGIDSYTFNSTLTDQYFLNPMKWWNPNVLIAGGASLPRKFPKPGDGFWYSDTNFVMLGQIIQLVTHRPLAQVMRADLFKPLGMRNSSYPTNNSMPAPFLRGYTAQGSEDGDAIDSTNWTPSFPAGAGAAISTLGDLHRLAVAVGTGALIKPATQRQRLIPNPASAGGGRAYLFALGYDNGWLGHEGQTPGYNTYVAYLPSLKASIVVITNTDIGEGGVTPAAPGVSPASTIFKALAGVIAPNHAPA
jgi:D-alanyl-D-alanine carboxypeptidase